MVPFIVSVLIAPSSPPVALAELINPAPQHIPAQASLGGWLGQGVFVVGFFWGVGWFRTLWLRVFWGVGLAYFWFFLLIFSFGGG